MFGRDSDDHGGEVSCIVPSGPSAEESELESERKAPPVRLRAVAVLEPSSRQTQSRLRTGTQVARALGGRGPRWLHRQPIRAETAFFTCWPVSLAIRAPTNVFAPGEPRLPSQDECDSRASLRNVRRRLTSLAAAAILGLRCKLTAGLCRCAVGHDDHLQQLFWG
jgi:hypothetical protein